MEHESDGDTDCNWCTCYSHQRIGSITGGLENKRMSKDHYIYSIVEIGQNTEKSSGDLRRLTVTQTPVKKNYQLMQVWKAQKSKIVIDQWCMHRLESVLETQNFLGFWDKNRLSKPGEKA